LEILVYAWLVERQASEQRISMPSWLGVYQHPF
jgi:hypothetical protein